MAAPAAPAAAAPPPADTAGSPQVTRTVQFVLNDQDPLVKATKKGDVAEILSLLEKCPKQEIQGYVNAKDKNGSTPIFHTVWPGHLEALQVLLRHGADPNVQNNRLNTALHLACERGHRDLIQSLVIHGAEYEIQNTNNKLCYETVADPQERREIENWVKKCYNDRTMGVLSETYKLTVDWNQVTPFSKAYYKSYYDTFDKGLVAKVTESKELKQALEFAPEGPRTKPVAPREADSLFLAFASDALAGKSIRVHPRSRSPSPVRDSTFGTRSLGFSQSTPALLPKYGKPRFREGEDAGAGAGVIGAGSAGAGAGILHSRQPSTSSRPQSSHSRSTSQSVALQAQQPSAWGSPDRPGSAGMRTVQQAQQAMPLDSSDSSGSATASPSPDATHHRRASSSSHGRKKSVTLAEEKQPPSVIEEDSSPDDARRVSVGSGSGGGGSGQRPGSASRPRTASHSRSQSLASERPPVVFRLNDPAGIPRDGDLEEHVRSGLIQPSRYPRTHPGDAVPTLAHGAGTVTGVASDGQRMVRGQSSRTLVRPQSRAHSRSPSVGGALSPAPAAGGAATAAASSASPLATRSLSHSRSASMLEGTPPRRSSLSGGAAASASPAERSSPSLQSPLQQQSLSPDAAVRSLNDSSPIASLMDELGPRGSAVVRNLAFRLDSGKLPASLRQHLRFRHAQSNAAPTRKSKEGKRALGVHSGRAFTGVVAPGPLGLGSNTSHPPVSEVSFALPPSNGRLKTPPPPLLASVGDAFSSPSSGPSPAPAKSRGLAGLRLPGVNGSPGSGTRSLAAGGRVRTDSDSPGRGGGPGSGNKGAGERESPAASSAAKAAAGRYHSTRRESPSKLSDGLSSRPLVGVPKTSGSSTQDSLVGAA